MPLLDTITSPDSVKKLSLEQVSELAAEIRTFLVEAVALTGGHLGPNLGAVELTLALHRVFNSPKDRLLFDTGHQTYVHKIVTGRAGGFSGLRQRGGLSGYPSRAESEHDIIENSHASTALSYADGLAKAYQLRGETDRCVVAVIGDGALTGGMAWEALNNISGSRERPLIIVVNDNGRSYSPTIGGLARHFAALRLSPKYEAAMKWFKTATASEHGATTYELAWRANRGLKDLLTPQAMFQDFGLKYLGPVDGHDQGALERALGQARDFGGAVIVHCITQKGRGFAPAEDNIEDCLHGPGPFCPQSGRLRAAPTTTWTSVFGARLAELGAARPDLVAITAAMLHPTGLAAFADRFPERTFDVGIAEQHAMTSAAGLALGGMHPVVAVYATFLNRAFDQLLMDVALHRLPVTVVLDRAGVTGDDGASHNGMWDLSLLRLVPGLRVATPRDEPRLRELIDEAVQVSDGPTVVRFPKGPVGPELPAIDRVGAMDVLARGTRPDVLLIGAGPMAGVCVEAAAELHRAGVGATVVDLRWVQPIDPALGALADQHRLVAVVEDNGCAGGLGDAIARYLRQGRHRVPVQTFGIPQQFLAHAKRAQILEDIGLTPSGLSGQITALLDELSFDGVADAVLTGIPGAPEVVGDWNSTALRGSTWTEGT